MTDLESEIIDGGEIIETSKKRRRETIYKYRKMIFTGAAVFLGLLIFLPIVLAYLTRPSSNPLPVLPITPTLPEASPTPKLVVDSELIENDKEIRNLENMLTDLNLLEPQLNFPSLDWKIEIPQN